MGKKCVLCILIVLIIVIGGYAGKNWTELRQLCSTKDCKNSEIEKIDKTGKDNEEELQEAMPGIIDVVIDDFKITALCEDGSVWNWDRNQSKASACKISNLSNITKLMYAGPAMYALSEDGHVYAWGSNKWLQISADEERDKNFEKAEQVLGLDNIVDMDVSVDFDSSRARVFAIDESGNFYVWGLYLYWDEEKDYEPGFPEKSAELVQGVNKLFSGAGNYHYFIREDGTVFSIMDNSIWEDNHINDFIFPTLPIELPDLSVNILPLYLSDILYVDLREGTKYGTTILYELGQDEDIKCIDADKYTVFVTREDGTLWYWNSKMIKYHDCRDALADSESCQEDYSGFWEKVNIKEILNIADESNQSFNVVDICAGSENVLFLTDDGQVFMSEYVTSSTEDIEYYNQENTNPDRDRIKKVKDLSLKTISFQKLDWENIISINSDGLYYFSAVDEAGRYFYTNPKDSIQETIMSGDFSCLEDEDWEIMQEIYEGNDSLEWRQLDLNGDGIDDLILQEKDTVDENSNQHRILGIFACGEDRARCVLWDTVDTGEFSVCGLTGELMYYYNSFGSMVDMEEYSHYYYDKEWNKVIDYQLIIWYVDSPEGYDYPAEWFEAHPDMQEEGIYYRKYEGGYAGNEGKGEVLTLEELKEIYETEMGMEIFSFRG